MNSLDGSSAEYKKYIVKQFEEGEALYKKYCAPCHGIFGPGNSDAPNFSKTALHNYNASFIRGDRENHAVAQKIEDESFDKILTILTYRK
jgi:mono/diheme cytochrome c family protein